MKHILGKPDRSREYRDDCEPARVHQPLFSYECMKACVPGVLPSNPRLKLTFASSASAFVTKRHVRGLPTPLAVPLSLFLCSYPPRGAEISTRYEQTRVILRVTSVSSSSFNFPRWTSAFYFLRFAISLLVSSFYFILVSHVSTIFRTFFSFVYRGAYWTLIAGVQ